MITLTLPPLSDTKTTKMDPGSSVASDIHVTSDRMVISYRGFVMPNRHVVSIQTKKKSKLTPFIIDVFCTKFRETYSFWRGRTLLEVEEFCPAPGSPSRLSSSAVAEPLGSSTVMFM